MLRRRFFKIVGTLGIVSFFTRKRNGAFAGTWKKVSGTNLTGGTGVRVPFRKRVFNRTIAVNSKKTTVLRSDGQVMSVGYQATCGALGNNSVAFASWDRNIQRHCRGLL